MTTLDGDYVVSTTTIDALRDEAARAHVKHGAFSMVNPEMPALLKLAALIEEAGEVGRALTYDEGNRRHLRTELIQLGAICVSWVDSLDAEEVVSVTHREEAV